MGENHDGIPVLTFPDMNEINIEPSAATTSRPQPGVSDGGPQPDDSRPGRALRWLRMAARGIPTVVILSVLAGLAWWGNYHGWSLPAFSQLTGNADPSEADWCDEHGVPEEICISCNAELLPKGELHGWCAEHGVHECVLHHPELAQLAETPVLNGDDFPRAERAIAARPRTKNDPGCKMHLRRIQFPSIDSVNRAGIDIALVDRGPIVETIKVTGELVYDPTRQAHVSSRAAGTIALVRVNVGDSVRKGDVIAIVDATEVGQAKSKLLEERVALDLARKRLDRLARAGDGVIPGREIEETESALATAEVAVANAVQRLSNFGLRTESIEQPGQPIDRIRSQLKYLGFPEDMYHELGNSSNLLPICAPRDGVVVMRHAVAGEVVDSRSPLFNIVDTRQMWLMLNVPLEEASRISLGQKILFHPDGFPSGTAGTIAWISTDVDAITRSVQVRGQLDNTDGDLRNETFGSGEIILREESEAIVVPSQAIHWEGCCHVAFVRDKDYFQEGSFKVFHTRSVRPGATIDGITEVIAGLLPGEVVVTKGSGVLRAELLKGNLGAG